MPADDSTTPLETQDDVAGGPFRLNEETEPERQEKLRRMYREKSRAYRESNREKVREYDRARYEANEANREHRREYQRAYREANRETICERKTAFYKANAEKINAERRARLEANPEIGFKYRLARYGLTLTDFEAMRQAQGDRCLICKTHFGTTRQLRPFVDHCHRTNRSRGLLCNGCNALLGCARDDPKILRAAIQYLKDHS